MTITIDDGIADVRLRRPDKRNALDVAMFDALAEAGQRLKTEPDVRVVVLSGEGASFCAGLDLSAMAAISGGGATDTERSSPGRIGQVGDRITHLGQQICWVWQEVPVPVIAAVHGHALGGGFQLALGADIRIVHPATKMSVREVYYGMIPDMTGTLFLAQLVRPDIAKELTFTARLFDGVEANQIGLVTRLSTTPYDDAVAMAAEIAQRSPDAVRAAKRLINRTMVAGAADQFAAERSEIFALIGSPNQTEAVNAHFEQRRPIFQDPA